MTGDILRNVFFIHTMEVNGHQYYFVSIILQNNLICDSQRKEGQMRVSKLCQN